MLLNGTGTCDTEVHGESFAFDEIRKLAESQNAAPGDEFTVTLDLRQSGATVVVEHELTEFGELELDDEERAAWCEFLEEHSDVQVLARIWTCRNWEERFYASVRVDLPSIDDAAGQSSADLDRYMLEKYGTTTPSLEQVQRHSDEMLAQSDNPEIAHRARQNLSAANNPYRTVPPAPQAVNPTTASPDWSILLMPDNTPRANLFQRGYARAAYGRAMGDVKAPRIDYATVGQCKHIAAAYGGDVQEIDKRGGVLLKLLWWVLLFMLGVVALIGVFTPPVGWLVTGLVAWPFVHHYVTRRKLEPPFGPQH